MHCSSSTWTSSSDQVPLAEWAAATSLVNCLTTEWRKNTALNKRGLAAAGLAVCDLGERPHKDSERVVNERLSETGGWLN
mmetsp:Transcript_27109/g.82150  ORF Transcript_27109/g.82150 Transcript_27109/m.82150 type:complete len:80 (-) Transcript_27109:3113-3352(-)